ncbi:CBS domain-containing protein [Paraburkholderia sp. LEh10]|uniref:CBS domain-containing protein n=1 Tax=Paraburkholderia sp. LEh10 TaxID=2821353 RepID=UPI001AEB6768|nr:CBS domain-containing protein [Paraburkholderia sp. LEh10]MBP0593451.1 CBS domain-containing protein [Paraburkholderia sp. LEh10]
MRALDVMTTPVISVKPEMTVAEAAKVLVDHRISGVPVIDEKGSLVGMLSEGDLICRGEIGTQKRHRSWWLELFSSARDAKDYIKSHGNRVAEVMTTDVISVDEATSLREVANILEKRRIKRVPVMRAHQVVGLVSRANLVQALASAGAEPAPQVIPTDREIRAMLMGEIADHPWGFAGQNIFVRDGVVHLWGVYRSAAAMQAMRIAAERVHGVKRVEDHTEPYPADSGM